MAAKFALCTGYLASICPRVKGRQKVHVGCVCEHCCERHFKVSVFIVVVLTVPRSACKSHCNSVRQDCMDRQRL
jgi:hypothetical protein